MALQAHHNEHKDALRRMSDIVFENKHKLSEAEFLEVSNLQKKLHDTAAQMIQGRTQSNQLPRPQAPLENDEASESDDGVSDILDAERMVLQYERGEISLGWLVRVITEQGWAVGTKAAAVDAIRDLVTETSDAQGAERQTALGQQGAIQALATCVIAGYTSPMPVMTYKAMTTLGVLIRRHDANKTLLGEMPGALSAITRHMRVGAVPIESLAISLLSDAGFQHTPNQQVMGAVGTVDTIVHLLSQERVVERHDRVLKLMYLLLCSLGTDAPCLAAVAVDAGIVPLLLNRMQHSYHLQLKALEVLYRLYDDDEVLRERVVAEGAIQRVAGLLLDPTNPHENRSKAARALGELGSRSFPNRAVVRELGVIPVLKELQDEPSGRGRSLFAFALSRLDEEGNGIASVEVKRKKEQEERVKTREKREKEQEERVKAREKRCQAIVERITPKPDPLARRIQSGIAKRTPKPVAKKRTRK
mgnify:CR=1 FL=1